MFLLSILDFVIYILLAATDFTIHDVSVCINILVCLGLLGGVPPGIGYSVFQNYDVGKSIDLTDNYS